MNMQRTPSHPGGLIREVLLPELGLSVSALARHCGVSRNTMSKLINERADVTEDLAIRLSRALGSTPEFWLNMQARHNLHKLMQKRKETYEGIKRVEAA
ncbi:MAG: addiction module antidote protein, HigA family [Gammaproteobacteria bacterium]|nr:MAG: addiction module antidote protein, HigA family [Gammaproteobacteria bacterium]